MKISFLKMCLTALLLSLVSATALAQETTSAIRGVVTDESGSPLSGATVQIVNESTGFTRTVESNSNGQFNLRNLQISNDYTISVTQAGHTGQKVENIGVSLGQTANLSFSLATAADSAVEEIVVVGVQAVAQQIAVGPNSTFSLGDLQTAVAINRDIKDVIRLDPRVYINENSRNENAIQCGGQNPRFNSLTVDGIRMNDGFGLNSGGYPTERIPFSFDALSQVSVELAPFDVEYGGFTACNINAVFKSGTNEFHGSVYYDYNDDSLSGDKLEGRSVDIGDFDRTRYGVSLGGPIIQDKLFFFLSADKEEDFNVTDRGAIGSGAANEVAVSQGELNEIASIARDIYQYNPGVIPTGGFGNDDEKLLVKLDWNISDAQRLAFTYNYNDGFNVVGSDPDNNEIEFSNHYYERGAELKSLCGVTVF